MSDRPCWLCGEKHMAKDCPKNPRHSGKAKGVRVVEQGPDDFFLVQERRGLVPKTVRLADFLPQPASVRNSFSALAVKDNEELNNQKKTGSMTQVSTEPLVSVQKRLQPKHQSVRQIKTRLRQEKEEAENKKFSPRALFMSAKLSRWSSSRSWATSTRP